MINPYATSSLIATRQEPYVKPRLTAARDPKPGRRRFRLFGLRRADRG